jgi:hypothetical protein
MHFGAHKGTMVNGRDFFGSPFKLSWNLNDWSNLLHETIAPHVWGHGQSP